jgi:hypothetical protein
MACSGFCALGRPGGICPSAMARGAPWPAASPAGSGRGAGRSCSRPCTPQPTRRASSTGTFMIARAPSSEPISTRLGHNRGPRVRSPRPEPGRVQDQSPPAGRRRRPAEAPRAHPGPAARGGALRTAPGERGREAEGAGPPHTPPASYDWGYRVQPSADAAVGAPAWHPNHQPTAAHRGSHRPLQSRALPSPQPPRAPDEPVQAMPPLGHARRETGRQLPSHVADCGDHPLVRSAIDFANTP